jgi:expansin
MLDLPAFGRATPQRAILCGATCAVLSFALLVGCADTEPNGPSADSPSASDPGPGAPGASMPIPEGPGDTSGATSGQLPFSPQQSGEGTFYGATGEGTCGYPASPGNLDVAALNTSQWDTARYCGMCVQVNGPKGAITVRVVDSCPTCKKGDLDLSESAFTKLADRSVGRIPITWKAVPCATSGAVRYVIKEGSSKYWTAIQVRNQRLPVDSLEIETSTGMVKAERQSWNYFVLPKGNGKDGAFKVKVTSTTGAVLQDTLPSPDGGKNYSGTANF